MPNLYAIFKQLLPDDPPLVGVIDSAQDGVYVITLPDGGKVTARGVGTVGHSVFVRHGVIEGDAPHLTVETIEI
jgi:hypothetical protein